LQPALFVGDMPVSVALPVNPHDETPPIVLFENERHRGLAL
jgi:hypothetical protein